MKRVLLTLLVCAFLGTILLSFIRRQSRLIGCVDGRPASALVAPADSLPTGLTSGAVAAAGGMEPVARMQMNRPNSATRQLSSSSVRVEVGLKDTRQWDAYSIWTEEVPVTDELAQKLEAVMRSWTLVSDLRSKRPGPTNLAQAHGLLYEEVNMALEGAPAKSATYRDVFFFSGGTRAYRVDDFSTGLAIPKGRALIYQWEQ